MTGLEIRYKDRILNIASDGSSGVTIVKRNEELYFDVIGIDKNNFILQWMKNVQLETGDKIMLSVKDIFRITESGKKIPFEKVDEEAIKLRKDDIQLIYQEKLACFHALENKLKEEGLI